MQGNNATDDATEAQEQTKQFMTALAASDVDVRDISGCSPGDIIATWGVEADAPYDEWVLATLDNIASEHNFRRTNTVDDAYGRATVVFERY